MKIKILLCLIIIIAAALRFYQLGIIPPSISWDEAAVGYNAYTIANWGKDEWGRIFPLYFKSFEDDKSSVHVYATAVAVKILGLSDFSTRFPVALFGVLNVVLIFFLTKSLFKNQLIALSAAFFLAISPYAIQFSRFNHEANFALFFFMLGLYFFLKAIAQKPNLLPLSFLSFALSIFSYHAPKVVVPLFLFLLCLVYWKKLWKIRKQLLTSLLIPLICLVLIIHSPGLTGVSRMKQTPLTKEEAIKTNLYQQTQNMFLGKTEAVARRYLQHFSFDFLFLSGDINTKFSTRIIGQFYKADAVLIILGILALIIRRSKTSWLVFGWLILAPLPASIFGSKNEIPNSARALFMMGSWQIITACGLSFLLSLYQKKILQSIVIIVVLITIGWQLYPYLIYYYQNYSKKEAIGWQYGMREIVSYVKEHNGYFQVYMTDIRFQPYIFYLYYLKTPLPQFRDTVSYNYDIEKRKYSLVAFFDKYHFGDWDPIESMPNSGVLYVVTPSQYDGLKHRDIFDVKKLVRYPDGSNAYFLVSYP